MKLTTPYQYLESVFEYDYTDTLDEIISNEGFMSGVFNIGFRIEKDEDGNVKLYGFNRWLMFVVQCKKCYHDPNPVKLIKPQYNEDDMKKYRSGKMHRGRVRLEYVLLPSFFMAEIYRIFETVNNKYHTMTYEKILKFIRENTWINGKNKDETTRTMVDESELSKINSKYKLKDYQLQFIREYPELKHKSNLNGYILSLEQGMGKTLTATALALALKKDFILCVVPNSIKGNWQIEISEYLKAYKNQKVAEAEIYAIGESKHKFNKSKIKWLIVNHESIDKAIPYIPKDRSNTMIILDESHFFRNIDAQRAKALYEIKTILKSTDNLAMSGTPIKASPAELAPALALIDDTFTMEVAKIYAKAFSVKSTIVKELTKERFSGAIYRKTREEVNMGLPQKHESDIKVSLSNPSKYLLKNVADEIGAIYSDILKKEKPELEKYLKEYIELINKYCDHRHKDDFIRWVKLVLSPMQTDRLLAKETDMQYFNAFSKNYVTPAIPKNQYDHFKRVERGCLRLTSSAVGRAVGRILPPRRAEMFIAIYDSYEKTLVDRIINNDKKTVIFTSIKEVAKHISKQLNDKGIINVLITGDTSNDRTGEIQKFKHDDNIMVIVATSQTLSTGVTLTEANQMFIFGAPWRDADYKQMSDRIYRIGQTTDVNINTVLLDTGDTPNISTRMKSILKWSESMFSAFMGTDEPEQEESDSE